MYTALGILLLGLVNAAEVWGRDNSKAFRSMPAISNSLVNLGKMDISFHFNTKGSDVPSSSRSEHFSASPFISSKSDHEPESCPCSTLKNFRNPFLSSPSDMLSRILKSNDLFSSNQEPMISTMCCDSHEHVQEDTVYFEFGPKGHVEYYNGQNAAQVPIVDSYIPRSSMSSVTSKPKAIEIFFFPKKKDSYNSVYDFSKYSSSSSKKKDAVKKSEIQIVGDKELRNDFKNFKLRPAYSVEHNKDVTQEKEKIEKPTTEEKEDLKTTTLLTETVSSTDRSPPNTL